jgi:hypothetical protein
MNRLALDRNINELPLIMEGARRRKTNPEVLTVSAEHAIDLVGATTKSGITEAPRSAATFIDR